MSDRLSNYVDDDTRAIIKEGVESWRALKKHEDWNHWLRVGKTLATMQAIAMQATGAATKNGPPYKKMMREFYASPTYLKELADIHKSITSDAVKCWEHREEIEAWRATLGDKALRMNHPMTVWKGYQASLRPSERPVAVDSPHARLKQEHAKALERIDVLERQERERVRSSDGEVTVTLRDKPANIARVLISGLGDVLPAVLEQISKQRKMRERKEAA